MKRAAVSISSNIAEGQARQHKGELIQFLYIANGSLAELDTQRIIAGKPGFLSLAQSQQLQASLIEIGKMLYSLISKLKTETEN